MSALVLASASPRRRELLGQLGVVVEVVPGDVPEVRAPDETPWEYSRRVARAKAQAGWSAIGAQSDRLVLAADTEVVLDDRVFGKPTSADDAAQMLRDLSGREHLVLSSVALIGSGFDAIVTNATRVRFAAMSEEQIAAYVATGEPMGKAGAYAIQGHAAAYVAHIDGSYSGVMGLPLYETAELLRQAGYSA